ARTGLNLERAATEFGGIFSVELLEVGRFVADPACAVLGELRLQVDGQRAVVQRGEELGLLRRRYRLERVGDRGGLPRGYQAKQDRTTVVPQGCCDDHQLK